MNDIELELKQRLKEVKGDALAASADEVRALLDRCDNYRKRLHDRKNEWDRQHAQLMSDLADHRNTLAWARRRLDPEGKGTCFSVMDTYEVGVLIAEIERRRGRIVADRLLYGQSMDETVAQETIGVLKSAIEVARAAEAQWRKYLADSHAKQK